MSGRFASTSTRVVALVGGSHFVHHTYFMLLPPIFLPLRTDLGLTDPQLGLALGTLGLVVTAFVIVIRKASLFWSGYCVPSREFPPERGLRDANSTSRE